MTTTLLHWFRRDLRVCDDTSLPAASREADRGVDQATDRVRRVFSLPGRAFASVGSR